MTLALGLVLLGVLLVYGGVTGKSITHLFLGDNQTDRTPPTPTGTVSTPTGDTVTGTVVSPSGTKQGTGILPTIGKIIGMPFQGTHAKAFNVAGGSDNWQSENAVDISTPVGTPIYSPVSGKVGLSGSLGKGGRFEGLRTNIAGTGENFYFAHLSKLLVNQGDNVRAGQLIGYSGSANGTPHLHFATEYSSPLDWVINHLVTSH